MKHIYILYILVSEAYEICEHLPDATKAKTYPLADKNDEKNNGSDNDNKQDGDKGSASRSTTFSAIMFIAVLLLQSLTFQAMFI